MKKAMYVRSALWVAVMLASLNACGRAGAGVSTAKIDKLFEAWNKTDTPGCAVGVSQNNVIVYEHGYGMANLERGVPITPETAFPIASISKAFTSMSVLLAAEHGELSLDDEVQKFIPEWVDREDHLTIRHLLNNTSGLRDAFTLLGWAPPSESAGNQNEAILRMLARVASGQKVEGITVALSAGGVVSGRVTSVRGEPLVRMSIWAAQRVFDANGSSSLRPAAFAETNDRGEYRLADLAPGRYTIRAAPQPASLVALEIQRAAGENLAPPALPSPGSFATAFYPGTTDALRAAPIEVQRGGETRNIDIAVPNQRTYRILGRVTDASGEPVPRVGPGMLPTPWTLSRESQEYDPSSGRFEKTDVPPGVYWLRVQPAVPVTAVSALSLSSAMSDCETRFATSITLWHILPSAFAASLVASLLHQP